MLTGGSLTIRGSNMRRSHVGEPCLATYGFGEF
jgi:hypothetical protein